jgi:hypothetical protein
MKKGLSFVLVFLMWIGYAYSGGFVSVGDAPTTPSASTIYKENITTAWVYFDGTSCSGGAGLNECTMNAKFNVDKIIRTDTGTYDVYWKTAMANTNYAVFVTANTVTSASNSDSGAGDRTTAKVEVYTAQGNTWVNSAKVAVMVLGGQ